MTAILYSLVFFSFAFLDSFFSRATKLIVCNHIPFSSFQLRKSDMSHNLSSLQHMMALVPVTQSKGTNTQSTQREEIIDSGYNWEDEVDRDNTYFKTRPRRTGWICPPRPALLRQ
ncbi:hypothetical protein F4778DRAFT_755205 [Xylariomycetidae sp. FL2044]|nr:hypothetical protein F4778DRAFT_767009 [Xylariomycetidae sp. FL2044]KAH9883425.1 hypothetical protein F4778DRAFT_766912 [Xylariomycetidae sp. FL2044]KAH9883449.1 hypothetical protein F4778DRAFT_766842 [Xylariomycetidae sp. FL2044]KAH9884145.1 hypothetical protein F4778DRAFT_763742 [Xylariomycetidae sp. FL2044]KAH9888761.1 hypothetical protein F4778DRAFT_755205 [Xylariomycetidae sp. FL2044]